MVLTESMDLEQIGTADNKLQNKKKFDIFLCNIAK